jgi:hypothetical protein
MGIHRLVTIESKKAGGFFVTLSNDWKKSTFFPYDQVRMMVHDYATEGWEFVQSILDASGAPPLVQACAGELCLLHISIRGWEIAEQNPGAVVEIEGIGELCVPPEHENCKCVSVLSDEQVNRILKDMEETERNLKHGWIERFLLWISELLK